MNYSKTFTIFALTAGAVFGYASTTANQSMYNAYWSTANGFQSVAQLHNNAAKVSLTVQPVLYSPDGQAMNLSPVTMAPLGNATIDIGAALAANGWSQATTGTAIFQYQGVPGQLEVEIYEGNPEESISFTIPSLDKPYQSAMQDAVFLLPSSSSEIWVSLQNASAQTIHVTPSLTLAGSAASMAPVTLPPNGSSVVWMSAVASMWSGAGPSPALWQKNAVGGITLSQDGPAGALVTGAWIEDNSIGYSTTLTFVNPQTPGQTLFGTQILVGNAGLALGLPANFVIQSQLVLRNMSNQPASVQGTLTFSDNSGGTYPVPILALQLAAGQITAIDLGQVKSLGNVPSQVVCASLSLQYSGASGAVMGRVFGTSTDGSYGLYWALQPSAGNVYFESFWSTQDDWTPIFTVGNFATSSDQVTVLLTSNQGTYTLPVVNLKPLESRTINIRELLATAQPLPNGANFGGFRVSGASGQSKLMVKEHLIDPDAELATPFYGSYQYIMNAFFDENSTDLNDDGDTCCTVGASSSIAVYIGAQLSGEADDYQNEYFPYDGSYGSENTSVVTISFSGNTGTLTGGASGGSAVIWADIYGIYDSEGDEGEIGTNETEADVCKLSVSPAGINSACTGSAQTQIYNVSVNSDSCYLTNPTCSATASGDVSMATPPNTTCSITSQFYSGNIYFFAGTGGGSIQLTVGATANTTVLPSLTVNLPITCQ
jgi:hypothetical protein